MHEREVAAVAGSMQRRRRFGDVLADNRDVADLAVGLAELVVGEADGARIMRGVGGLQRAAVQRDRARLIAARPGETAVQPPERGQPSGRNRFAEGVGRPAERGGRLIEIVLQQPCFGEHGPHGQLLVARQRGGANRRREHLRGLGTVAAFQRRSSPREKCLQRGRRHRASIRLRTEN